MPPKFKGRERERCVVLRGFVVVGGGVIVRSRGSRGSRSAGGAGSASSTP